jgi:hypothetical protein
VWQRRAPSTRPGDTRSKTKVDVCGSGGFPRRGLMILEELTAASRSCTEEHNCTAASHSHTWKTSQQPPAAVTLDLVAAIAMGYCQSYTRTGYR